MKNSILLFFTLAILTFACKPSIENNSATSEITKSSSPKADISNSCFSSYNIYEETAFIWQSSWVTYYDEYRGAEYDDSPQFQFEEVKLNALYSEVSSLSDPGIIIWYVMTDQNDPYPSLAMQNTASCNIANQGTILMSHRDGSPNTIISQANLDTYKANWISDGDKNPSVYTEVYGYNYSWASVRSLMAENTSSSGIYINYGLRTIGPDESEYFEANATNLTGSVVYCNVIYDSPIEVSPRAMLDDFAMPCPRFCGDSSKN